MIKRKVYIFKDIKNKRWTVYDYETKKHLGYRTRVALRNCQFEVIAKKRQKVIESGHRFPHAWVVGYITSLIGCKTTSLVSYNPFKDKAFKCNKKIIKEANKVFLTDNGQVFI